MPEAINCPWCAVVTRFDQHAFIDGLLEDDGEQVNVGIYRCQNCKKIVYAKSEGDKRWIKEVLHPTMQYGSFQEYPDDVRDNFEEAVRSINSRNYKSSVMMTRSALQACM